MINTNMILLVHEPVPTHLPPNWYDPQSQIDIGLPPSSLATIPWIGLAIGFAFSSIVMARFPALSKLWEDKNCFRIFRVGQFFGFTAIVAGGMFTLGAMLLLLAKESGNKTAEGVVLVVSLVVATIAIDLWPGSVPYTLMGELFPAEYRTLGSCVVLVVRYHKIIQRVLVFQDPWKSVTFRYLSWCYLPTTIPPAQTPHQSFYFFVSDELWQL